MSTKPRRHVASRLLHSRQQSALVRCLSAALLALTSVTAHALAGETDTTFATGVGRYAFAFSGATGPDARALAVQPDGKIIIAGGCHNGSDTDFCVARLTANGALDSTFVGPAGTAAGKFLLPVGTGNDGAVAVALQPDGRIILAGTCSVGGVNNFYFCLARLQSDGSLDASFNGPDAAGTGEGAGHGRFTLSITGNAPESLAALTVQPDGKILVAGSCSPAPLSLFCVARLNPNGSFDSSFNGPDAAGSGVGNGQGRFAFAVGTGGNSATAMTVQPDGKIIVVGSCQAGATAVDFCAARLMASDGRFDVAFDGGDNIVQLNGNGKVVIAITTGSSNDFASAVAVRPDGMIYIVGSCWNGSNYDFCGTRLEPDSGRKRIFYATGFASFTQPVGGADDFATGLLFQPDGKFIITGQCQNGTIYQFCAARFLSDGGLDASFDGGTLTRSGRFLLPPILADDHGNAAALQTYASVSASANYQNDNRLLIAGRCTQGTTNFFCVTRLQLGENGAQQCALDIDGDGRMLATVDGLIATRLMLGIRGPAVIAGISFPPAATRSNWPAMQRYLSSQCGVALSPDLASQ